MNHIPFYFESKSQSNCTKNTVKYRTVQYCITVFIVVFQVYANYLILKFNKNEFDERLFFEVMRNWINFRLRSFLYQGTLWQKIKDAVSYKLVSYMRVLAVYQNLNIMIQDMINS